MSDRFRDPMIDPMIEKLLDEHKALLNDGQVLHIKAEAVVSLMRDAWHAGVQRGFQYVDTRKGYTGPVAAADIQSAFDHWVTVEKCRY